MCVLTAVGRCRRLVFRSAARKFVDSRDQANAILWVYLAGVTLFGDLLMSEIRANILDHLTREAHVSSTTLLEKFASLHRVERDAVCVALDDLRHLGLIEISAGAVTLTPLAMRLSR